MEFDQYIASNILLVLGLSILFIITCFVFIFFGFKLRFPVKVNCWFCNRNTKIWRHSIEWWQCPSCHQYNGFSKSGDYNYKIPEQYNLELNKTFNFRSKEKNGLNKCGANGLCKDCNKKESTKLTKLINFKSSSEKSYDCEVVKYKKYLEEKYPICNKCKKTIDRILYKQSTWLTEYKMLIFRQKPIITITKNHRKLEIIFRIILTVLDSGAVCYTNFWQLPVGGFFLQLYVFFISSSKKKIRDVHLSFLWFCMIILKMFSDIQIFKIDLLNSWFLFNYMTEYNLNLILAIIICFMNIKPNFLSTRIKNLSFKKLGSKKGHLESDIIDCVNDNSFKINDSNEMVNHRTPINVTSLLMSPNKEASIVVKPKALFCQTMNSNMTENAVTHNITSSDLNFMENKEKIENCSFNSNLSTLSSLSLSDDPLNFIQKTPRIFETKVYGTTCSDIFKKTNSMSTRKYILSPPKFRSFTQASWVAGGYWQEGMDPRSLSRSSSQSSGFDSAGSNFGPSREQSIYDFDQQSVVSSGTQLYYPTRPNSVNSLVSSQHNNSLDSFRRPKSPVSYQESKFSNQSYNLPNCPPSSNVCCHCMNNHVNNSQTDFNTVTNTTSTNTIPYSNNTILAAWLPILLCGSFILNMIVFVKNLMR